MVAKIETGIASGRLHYGWLHPWTRGGTIDDFIHGCRSLTRREKKVWSTGHILKIEINFQSEAKPQHESKNGLETYNADFKLQSRNLFNANLILWCQLSTGNKFNVSGRKKKVRNTGKYSENRIPLSTIFRRLGAPHSVDRFSTLQVILVDRCPVPSDLQPGGRPSPKKKCATEPDRTYFRKYFKSMAKNWLFLIVNSWFWSKP